MKKLIFSAVMLLLTCMMAVASVIAWFSIQNSVGIGAPEIPIDGDYVTSVSISYYYATVDGAGGFTQGAQLAAGDGMPVFSMADSRPIIAKIDFDYPATADFTLAAKLSCTCPSFVTVTKDESGHAVVGNAYLSNIAEFTFLNKTGGTLTADGAALTFYADGVKSVSVAKDLSFTRTVDGRYTVYMLMAYNRAAIGRFFFLLLQQGIASDATVYEFAPDLSIGFTKGAGQ